jgi:type I restriction enzyme, S subunit
MQNLITKHLDIWTSAHKTRSGVGRGSSNKLDLYGIKKLRELILELAVRGTLVPQDPNDEPASELITKHKKNINKKDVLGFDEDEKPFLLCPNWEIEKLGNIASLITKGTTPTTLGFMYQSSGVSFVKVENIDRGRIQSGTIDQYISEDADQALNRSRLEDQDILFSIAGTIGKTCIVYSADLPANTNQALAIIRGTSGVFYTRFLQLQLESFVAEKTRSKARGGAMPNVSLGDLSSLVVIIPPLAEQHRIVAKVDELMAFCDQLEQTQSDNIAAHAQLVEALLTTLTNSVDHNELKNNWQRIAEHFGTLFTTEHSIDQLKQTILQLAVMGKLVPQNPNDEPASELLKKIAAEKEKLIKEGKIKKEKPLPKITDEEKPFELPSGWEWCRLPDIGELARGKSKHRPRNDPKLFADGTVPLIQTGDVARSEKTIQTYSALYNDFGLAQSRLWPKGTMCITIAANIADTGLLEFEACFPDSVVGFLPYDKNIPVEYFESFIKVTKDHLEKFAPSTAQKNINLEILGDLLVPCPPANEIRRIVVKIDELMDLCDTLKTNIQNAQATQLALADVLVEQAVG